MQKYIAVIDNGTDVVPPREEWRTVEAYDAKGACFEYVKGVDGPGGLLKILVVLLAQFEAHGWGGCLVHTFDVKRTPIDKEEAAKEYEEKKQERIDRFEDRASDARRESANLGEQARKMADVIPLGQPILIGHHSEHRDRAYRGRIENKFRASFEAQNKADYYEGRAESAASNRAIYSDDPKAEDKLAAKIRSAEELQEQMKACNAAIRKNAKAGPEAQIAALVALVALGRTEAQARQLITPDFCRRIGFPDYALQNNSANIRRMKKRTTPHPVCH